MESVSFLFDIFVIVMSFKTSCVPFLCCVILIHSWLVVIKNMEFVIRAGRLMIVAGRVDANLRGRTIMVGLLGDLMIWVNLRGATMMVGLLGGLVDDGS